MSIRFSRIYVVIHLCAVLALAVAPFIFFNVYADGTQNVWTVTIPKSASGQGPVQGFYPDELPILVGDTLVWKNNDSVIHSITSGIPEHPDSSGLFFNLGEINPGKSNAIVLTNSDFLGFYYFCEIHPWMTGKIFISNLEVAQPETEKPIITNDETYTYGDSISISGQVHQDFAKTEYSSLIYNENNKLVDVSYGYFNDDATYLETIKAKGDLWKSSGNYQIKLVYGLPSKVAQTSFQFANNFKFSNNEQSIPTWIKNIGNFWCNGQMDDSEFINAIQYLIKKDVIHLKNSVSDTMISNQVPDWVKRNACWWTQDKISDFDFISGIEYLVKIGTIRV